MSIHPAGDRGIKEGTRNDLYRNDCPSGVPGKFTRVSREAGILADPGYGLGVVVADLNRDGWPDIYVSNDVLPNDVIYVNNQNGTFSNKAATWLKHASYAGMGVDVADFNNDGWPDILQADMMPRDLSRRKRIGVPRRSASSARAVGAIHDDYSQNSCSLATVLRVAGSSLQRDWPLRGVCHTDWSWSALLPTSTTMADKDIFIGNGLSQGRQRS